MPSLYVVATPIGNLSDASARMAEVLAGVGLIAAEDTRVTGNLLRHFGISTPMTSLHRHNEAGKTAHIIARMQAEAIDAALVTDAGTPAISDPGYLLVDAAWQAGITVLGVPGPTAMATALSVSGFDTREFAFYGFLPRERGDLVKRLKAIASGPRVAVLHESPHRVVALLEAMADTLPGCRVCACCDLTKRFERTDRGPVEDVLAALRANPKVEKGEYCVVADFSAVALPQEAALPSASAEAQIFEMLLNGDDLQAAVSALTGRGMRKNEAKRAALRVQQFLSEE